MNYIFDLDNTLIYSDAANNLAYKEAVRNVIHKDLDIRNGRITRGDIASRYPNLTATQLSKIIKEKEKSYAKYFDFTLLNIALLNILKQLSSANQRTILMTYSGSERAGQLLDFYGINKYFSEKYYKEDFGNKSKYKFATDILSIDSRKIVLFENETEGCSEAISDGFAAHNIIKIV
ncbi:MAG: hypothetical protein PUC50_13995 [Bacteroidales bacterium]|nr:hypothetical protein [Bacteroidales bacterium]